MSAKGKAKKEKGKGKKAEGRRQQIGEEPERLNGHEFFS
jgi:hypothetical protein